MPAGSTLCRNIEVPMILNYEVIQSLQRFPLVLYPALHDLMRWVIREMTKRKHFVGSCSPNERWVSPHTTPKYVHTSGSMIHKNDPHISHLLFPCQDRCSIVAELLEGLAEGGEQVARGDRGQVDRVHRHHGQFWFAQTNKHPLELAWNWYKHCKRHKGTEGSVL